MKKSIFYCDVCGKEFAEQALKHMCKISLQERDLITCREIKCKELDICFDCRRELYRVLRMGVEDNDT